METNETTISGIPLSEPSMYIFTTKDIIIRHVYNEGGGSSFEECKYLSFFVFLQVLVVYFLHFFYNKHSVNCKICVVFTDSKHTIGTKLTNYKTC